MTWFIIFKWAQVANCDSECRSSKRKDAVDYIMINFCIAENTMRKAKRQKNRIHRKHQSLNKRADAWPLTILKKCRIKLHWDIISLSDWQHTLL